MYRFSRGSTLSLSPTFTKSGTCTTPPVSSVAGFVTFETVSPFTPGSVSTTVNALTPGALVNGKRAIFELGRIDVHDGGADGDGSTGPNQLFMTQGLFVP